MKNSKSFLIGDVLSGSEAAFLRMLASSFPEPDTLFFANFYVGQQQIDFFVVTPTHAGLIELKHFTGPVFGDINGGWQLVDAAGNRVPHTGSSNPYVQALKQTYALSAAMQTYRKRAQVPDAECGQFFRNFKTYVAITPLIHPMSVVTPGDHKARILSANDVVERIRTHGHTSTWSLANWYAFATDQLHLRAVTLEEAIDPKALEAGDVVKRFRERSRALIGTNLPPLLAAVEPGAIYGAGLVDRLRTGDNVLLVGPSGSAKTFHLHHATMAMLDSDDELPILVEAKRYRGGDFWPFLRACLAPLFPADPRHLVDATTVAGVRPVLLIDALNECAPVLREDLLKGAVAFALQFDARTVITSQDSLTIAGLAVASVAVPLPDTEQRRCIYAFHARVQPAPELDELCGGFRNAYDLTIAGRCHGAARSPIGTLELYDRYVSECLPREHRTVAGALLRQLATEMGNRGSLHLTKNDCETTGARFLAQQGAPLTIFDDLIKSRLLEATGDVVTFEHELLFKHLRSSSLERSASTIAELCKSLQLPRNRELIEFIVPRLLSRENVVALLTICDDISVFSKAYDGTLGSLARTVVTDACDAFTTLAIAELPGLDVRFAVTSDDSGRRMFAGVDISGFSEVSFFEQRIAELLALKDQDAGGRRRLLTIIDQSQSALTHAVEIHAQADGFGPRAAFSELIRFYLGFMSSAQHPRSTLVLSGLKHRLSNWGRQPIHADFRAALRSRALAEPVGAFALYLLLETVDVRSDDGEQLIMLVEHAWATGMPYLRMTALYALTNGRTAIDAAGPAAQHRVATFLARIEANDWVLSSLIVEAQAHFETIEPLVSFDDALRQMRAIIAWDVPHDLELHLGQKGQNEWAYNSLSRIFEDVFQGAYYEAYEQLTEHERFQILSLAADAPNWGFSGSWIMQELRKLDRVEALPTFRKAATAIDLRSPFPQDQVAVFINAIYGFSKFAEAPPMRAVPNTPLEQAWYTIADALFWAFHDEGRHVASRGEKILAHLDGDVLLAAAAVLADIRSSQWQIGMEDKIMPTFFSAYPNEASRIAATAIDRRDEVRALFVRFGRDVVIESAVKTLGEIGTPTVLPTLRAAMNDESVGVAAIKALQDIEARSVSV